MKKLSEKEAEKCPHKAGLTFPDDRKKNQKTLTHILYYYMIYSYQNPLAN